MKTRKSILMAILPLLFLQTSCTVEISAEKTEDDDAPEISNSPLSGYYLEGKAFVPGSILCQFSDFAGDPKFYFHLWDEVGIMDCSNLAYNPSDISFSLNTKELKKGFYEGNGPTFRVPSGSASFFGADVLITSVTDSTVQGKVKGGNKEDMEYYIEGSFTAKRCSQ